jgi:hypothetical protein
MVFSGIALVMINWVFYPGFWALCKNEFEISLASSLQLYQKWGWEAGELKRAAEIVRLVFFEAALGWLVILIMAWTFVMYVGQRHLTEELPGAKVEFVRFTRWPTSERMIWLLMPTLLLLLVGNRFSGWPRWVVINSLLVLGAYYFFMGLAIVFFYLEQRNFARGLKVLVLILMLFFPGFVLFLIGIGIFDTWWDWRRLQTPALPEGGKQ